MTFKLLKKIKQKAIQNPAISGIIAGGGLGIFSLHSFMYHVNKFGHNYSDPTEIVLHSLCPALFGTTISFVCSTIKRSQERIHLEKRLATAKRIEYINKLAGGAAHHLNNIFSSTMGNTKLASMNVDSLHPTQKYLEKISLSTQRATDLVNNLLTLAKDYNQDKLTILNINNHITHYLKTETFQRLQKKYKHVSLETKLEDVYLIEAYEQGIRKSIHNLIINAYEAHKNNSGSIKIKTQNIEIEQKMEAYADDIPIGRYVLLSVEDQGVGIKETDLQQIFNPFFTTKGLLSGIGLGTTVIYGTIKNSNGYIVVDSKENQGTIFKLYFPAYQEELIS